MTCTISEGSEMKVDLVACDTQRYLTLLMSYIREYIPILWNEIYKTDAVLEHTF